jgi:ABC-type transport system involved in cytochrome bd biosynthesis fused ATPase/permease subunit
MSPRRAPRLELAAAAIALAGVGWATALATAALAAQRIVFPIAALELEAGNAAGAGLIFVAALLANVTRTLASERIAARVRTNVFDAFLVAAVAVPAPMADAAEIVVPRFSECMAELVLWAQSGVVGTLAGIISAPIVIGLLLRELGIALVGPMLLGAAILVAGAAIASPRISAAWQAAWQRTRAVFIRFLAMHQGLVELRAQAELPRFAAATRADVQRLSIEDARARRLQDFSTSGIAAVAVGVGVIATSLLGGGDVIRSPGLVRGALLAVATLPSLMSLVSGMSRLTASRSELAIVGRLPRARAAEPSNDPFDPRAELRFEDITFTYPAARDRAERRIISTLDLTLREGGSLAVVGPNGSGKTTLLHLLVGVLVPDAGRVILGGRDARLDDPRWHERIAFVSQRSLEMRDVSIAENMRVFAPAASNDELIAALRVVGVWSVLRLRVSSDAAVLALPLGSLSRGEARRVALARAFARRADLVVLDEPEANLDDNARRELLAALRDIARHARVVVAVHDRAMAAFADEIIELAAPSGSGDDT